MSSSPINPGRVKRLGGGGRCSIQGTPGSIAAQLSSRQIRANDGVYRPKFVAVRMLNMDLRMTNLLEACARGFEGDCGAVIEQIRNDGGEDGLKVELAATDDWAGSAALYWAAYSNSAACIEQLLDAGACVDIVNSIDGSSPLCLATDAGRADVALHMCIHTYIYIIMYMYT